MTQKELIQTILSEIERLEKEDWGYSLCCDKKSFGTIPGSQSVERYAKAIKDFISSLPTEEEQTSIIVIPKFRVGDNVVSKKNPRLTYNILEVGHINELNYQEYKVEIFTDGKADEPANIKYIEIRRMDEWGELIEQKPAEYIKRNSKEWYSLLTEQYDKGFWKGEAEQKPTEWSEEDERILKGIIGLIDHNQHYGVGNKEMIAWLKSLRPQKQEWGKEELMRWARSKLRLSIPDLKIDITISPAELIDKLNSL